MKELRKKITNLLRSEHKYSLRTMQNIVEEDLCLIVSEEDILDSFFDILISEINGYNFKNTNY